MASRSLRWLALALVAVGVVPLMPGSGPGMATADDYEYTFGDYLLEGWILNSGMAIGDQYTLHMQRDCNVVLYPRGHLDRPKWASNTAGRAQNCNLIMQSDCNLVVYETGTQNALWASQTAGLGYTGCRLYVQNDGNAVIYDDGEVPRWSTHTRW